MVGRSRPSLFTTAMTSREVFGIVVRVAGLWITYNGLTSLVGPAIALVSPATNLTPSGTTMAIPNGMAGALLGVVTFAILQLVLGLWMTRGAPQLVAWAYDREGARM